MIVGILGFAQTGKDTVANLLTEYGHQKIGFADYLKRVVMDLFEFEPHQMWGTVEQKEAPDLRYPREHTWAEKPVYSKKDYGYRRQCLCCGIFSSLDALGVRLLEKLPQCYLTPRYAMKLVGTEGARHCWNDIWVKRALDYAHRIERGCQYNQQCGIESEIGCTSAHNAVFIDCRFVNEVEGILKAGGKVYRVKRAGYDKPMFDHASETEQLRIPDDRLAGVILNDGTLDDLKSKVLRLLYPDFD